MARLGPKAYEQAAGFLRIVNGSNPLDASAVHPEAYEVVERIAEATKRPVKAMIGDSAFLKSLNAKQFADDRFGTPTVSDILVELEKPGRDPRPEFKTAEFKEGVEKIADLRPGMMLEGVVTNVDGVRRLRRCRGAPGWFGARIGAGRQIRERSARRSQGGGRRQGAREGRRRRTQANSTHDEVRRDRNAIDWSGTRTGCGTHGLRRKFATLEYSDAEREKL